MGNSNDIRWEQRFANFGKALLQLHKALDKKDLSDLEEEGMIKRFEYTYELAWKTMQDLLKERGYPDIVGPRPVIEQCLEDGIITNGEVWMRMIKSRNLTAHVYDEKTVEEIAEIIRTEYFDVFKSFYRKLDQEQSGPQNNLFEK